MKELVSYYENEIEELKEKAKEDEVVINVFAGRKYGENIRKVYWNLLSNNVSVNNLASVVRFVLKELANIQVERLPQKSLAAEMFAEMNIASSVQVHEAIMESDNKVLHADGTKYNFNEV